MIRRREPDPSEASALKPGTRAGWGLSRALLAVVPALWVAHTLAGVLFVGVSSSRFTEHKVSQGFVPSPWWTSLVAAHAVLACVALLAGSASAREAVNKSFGKLHRTAGRIYALSVLGSGLLSIPLLPSASGGFAGRLGLSALLLSWLVATGWAVYLIRQRDIMSHRRWMTRSYALTFANLVLHVLQGVLISAANLDRELAYGISAATCTLVCLLAAEVVIWRQTARSRHHAEPRSPKRDSAG